MANTKIKNQFTFCTEDEVIVKLKAASLFDKYNNLRLSGRQLFMDFCTGKSLRALTYDAILKKIFSYEQHPKRLEHFLSAILEQDVTILKILPVESERLLERGSVMIMDILVKLAVCSLPHIWIWNFSSRPSTSPLTNLRKCQKI